MGSSCTKIMQSISISPDEKQSKVMDLGNWDQAQKIIRQYNLIDWTFCLHFKIFLILLYPIRATERIACILVSLLSLGSIKQFSAKLHFLQFLWITRISSVGPILTGVLQGRAGHLWYFWVFSCRKYQFFIPCNLFLRQSYLKSLTPQLN